MSDIDNLNFTTKEYAIGGKLIAHRLVMGVEETFQFKSSDSVKRLAKEKLTNSLVNYLLENNFIEFTHTQDYSSDSLVLYARCYMAPNDQVKILRQYSLCA